MKSFLWQKIVLMGCVAAGLVAGKAGAQRAEGGAGDQKVIDAAKDAKGLEDALKKLRAPTRNTRPLAPLEEWKKLKPQAGLAVDLIAAEPVIRQPLNIHFDERGRMWVIQYIQYPFPRGLKIVEYDQYIRAKFDKTPLPPPKGVRGDDIVTILEDVDHDGSFKKVKTFVDGLNIATSALPGRGGVWVTNPPYLLFYPDKNGDDVPDGDPVVHLSGFGLEDTHAVMSSLMWGPDGWIYGAQGSTCTAKVKVEISDLKSQIPDFRQPTTNFLGQAIWRYHPERHIFEIFAEGGGNTFGVEFDDFGRVYSGTNWGALRGVCYEQGSYYVKGWGKHGPLTNPYAFGFFDHMPHSGNGDRLTHTFIVYGEELMRERFGGKILGPSPLQSRIHVTRLEQLGSNFKTVEEPFLLTSEDGWFRPVDLKAGPDGALYVADMYEDRISHVDPRDNWDRRNGRLWRVRPEGFAPGLKEFDLAKATSEELVKRLDDPSRWNRAMARRILADRKDAAAIKPLKYQFEWGHGSLALESMWGLYVMGAFDDSTALAGMDHANPHIRRWAVRLVADEKKAVSAKVLEKLSELADREKNVEVRSQLASSAKRLPGDQAVGLVRQLAEHAGDEKDPHIPLLVWWALENKAVSHRELVLKEFATAGIWQAPMARGVLMSRLARRYAADPTVENQKTLLKLLASAPGEAERKILLGGVVEAFKGGNIPTLLAELSRVLMESGNVELALRGGDEKAHEAALALVGDEGAKQAQRVAYIEILGQVGRGEASGVLLEVIAQSKSTAIRKAAIAAMVRFEDVKVAEQLISLYPKLPITENIRPTAVSVLLARADWTESLLKAIERKEIGRSELSADQIDRIRMVEDKSVAVLAEKVLGKAVRPTSEQKSAEIGRIKKIVMGGEVGNFNVGKSLFTTNCAVCHTLFKEGGKVGPDLTGYERNNIDTLLLSIVDPNAYIREEFQTFRVKTKDRQSFVGLISERNANQISVVDSSQQRTVIPKVNIVDERALPVSIMPEELLGGLSDQQLRDLFAYLMAAQK